MMLLGFSIGIQALSCQDNPRGFSVIVQITQNKITYIYIHTHTYTYIHTIRMKMFKYRPVSQVRYTIFLKTLVVSAPYHLTIM
jgi:hypothetical protein